MPSPFPGMDPFIESQEWSEFHFRAINAIADSLGPRLGERYVARCQMRVYVERNPPEEESPRNRHIEPDVSLVRDDARDGLGVSAAEPATIDTVVCDLPEPETRREVYLVLRDLWKQEVVTVLELLSPANKRVGSDGRSEYLRKRQEVIESDAHFVEIDLLRGGARMPMRPRAPVRGDYVVLVSRSEQRPAAELLAWSIRRELPTVPIPLAKGDPDVFLDLQAVFSAVYDRARLNRTLNYSAPLVPPADAETQRWIDEILRSNGLSGRAEARPESPSAEPPA